MTPTTSRPRALLRAAVAALGLWLAVIAVLNLFIVGRAATDENLFIDPLSALTRAGGGQSLGVVEGAE